MPGNGYVTFPIKIQRTENQEKMDEFFLKLTGLQRKLYRRKKREEMDKYLDRVEREREKERGRERQRKTHLPTQLELRFVCENLEKLIR